MHRVKIVEKRKNRGKGLSRPAAFATIISPEMKKYTKYLLEQAVDKVEKSIVTRDKDGVPVPREEELRQVPGEEDGTEKGPIQIAEEAKAEDDNGGGTDICRAPADRKSTRLNSSHANISYAVFCLKKKN